MNVEYFSQCRSIEDLDAQKENLYQLFGLGRVRLDQFPRKNVDQEYENLKMAFKAMEKPEEISSEELTLEEILEKIHGFKCHAEICGKWLWLSGPKTYSRINDLKELGFRYAKNKKAWYWRPESARSNNQEPMSMVFIREKYGSEEVKLAG